jgi:hypothetical protein
MRYFFPARLAEALGRAGFAALHFSAFPSLDRTPDSSDWNIVAVATAIDREPVSY